MMKIVLQSVLVILCVIPPLLPNGMLVLQLTSK